MKENEQSEKVLKILEQQYQSFINQQDNWDFFRGLAEYTKIIQNIPQTKAFIETLEEQRKLAYNSYEMMNSQAMKEFTKSAQRLIVITKEITKQYEPIGKIMQEVQDRIDGRILSSKPLTSFYRELSDVVRIIQSSGYEKVIKEFENNKKETKNIYGNYIFSPTYEKIDKEEQKLKRKEQIEAWGAWQQLPIVKRIVFEPDEVRKELEREAEKNPSLQWTLLNFIGVTGEMEKIREGKGSDDDMIIFRVKDYRSYAQRIHNFLTTELIKSENKQEKLDFDDTNRLLYFMGEGIIISKKEESDTHKLIRTLFKDIHRVWANDEILEDWGYSFDEKLSKNKVYQAGKAINQVVAQETKIKDFLIVTTKNVSINKEYLKT